MRFTCTFLLVLCLGSIANAEQAMSLIQMKVQAGDAVSAVVDVLNDLKQSALDERADLQTHHEEREAYFAETLREQSQVIATNQEALEAANANEDFVEAEIQDTADYIAWINGRFDAIAQLVEDLSDERCEASLIFVTRLREHFEAIDAIALLRQDLVNWQSAGQPTLVEIKQLPSFGKLQAYATLFKKDRMDSFLALTDIDDGYLDESRRDLGDDFVDNEQGEQVLQEYNDPTPNVGGTIVDRVLAKLDDFEFHLGESLKDLTQNEIRAGRDTVRYQQEAEQEVYFLQNELEAREIYATKLENDLVVAQNYVAQATAALEASVQAKAATEVALQEHRDFFLQETQRLAEDVKTVEWVIEIFYQELQGIDDIIRNMKPTVNVDDIIGDRFSQGAFGANDDNEVGAYTGEHGYNAADAF